MENSQKEYENDEIKVFWRPDICIHSRLCWKNLKEVFDPVARPWININGSTTEKIIKQIDQCPSGALSYKLKNMTPVLMEEEKSNLIEVKPDGPLICHGKIILKDAQGNEVVKENVTAFCRCGASANKPFCDGSHRKIEFKG